MDLAVFASDIHLCFSPPRCRTGEKDWVGTQIEYLTQLVNIADDCPIVIAGDVFDKWHTPVELVNAAIDVLKPHNTLGPGVFAIPGQHDLPYHRYKDMSRTAYGTLVRADAIRNLDVITLLDRGLRLHPFPWGKPIEPCKPAHYRRGGRIFDVAVCHHFIWNSGRTGYTGASDDDHVEGFRERLSGYDLAVFGDNHKPFQVQESGSPIVLNCGGFMRRTKAELDHKPAAYVLHVEESGPLRLRTEYLDISEDEFLVDEEVPEQTDVNLDRYVDLLSESSDAVDYLEVVRRAADGHGEDVRAEIESVLEEIDVK
jgi:DNA repair exonuclease SbcCD nuclease subunit